METAQRANTQPPKTRTETGQKRTKATPTGKHSRKAETSEKGQKTSRNGQKVNRHEARRRNPPPPNATSGAGRHEKRTAEAVLKKRCPKGGVLASVSAVLYLPSVICRRPSTASHLPWGICRSPSVVGFFSLLLILSP